MSTRALGPSDPPFGHPLAPIPVSAPMTIYAPPGAWMPPPAAPPAASGGVLSLMDHLLQHLRLFALVWLLAIAAGALYWAGATPVYRADAMVQVEGRAPRSLAPTLAAPAPTGDAPISFVQGEIAILRSREIVGQAIERTRADVRSAIDNRFPLVGELYARIAGRHAREPLAPPFGLGVLDGFAWGGERLRLADLRVPRTYLGRPLALVVGEGGRWSLFDDDDAPLAEGGVGVRVPFGVKGSPGGVVQVAEMAARPGARFVLTASDPNAVYDDLSLDKLRIEETGRQSGVIRISLDHGDPRFAAAFLDTLTHVYLDRQVRVNSGDGGRALAFLEAQLPAAKRDLERAEEALNTFRTATRTIDVAAENETALGRIAELERQRVEIGLRRQDLMRRFTDEHPEAAALRRQMAILDGELGRVRGQLNRSPRQERDVVRLQRDMQVASQAYTTLLASVQDLRVKQAGITGNARLVDAAGVHSRPVRPRLVTVLSLALGLGFVLAMAAVLLARLLRPTLRTSDEVEQQTGLATVAVVPESPLQRALTKSRRGWRQSQALRLLALRAPAEPAVESLRGLRNGIDIAERDGANRVLITAATEAAGKSFVAANLAVLTAATGRRTLLVDLDLRAPTLHAYFGVERPRVGLADLLDARCAIDDAILTDVLPNLDLLLPGKVSGHPADLLTQPRFEVLMRELAARYRRVVIDSAPVLPVSDTLAIARAADATYLVVRSESGSVREVRDALRRLESAAVGVDGLVLNGVKRARLASMAYRGYFPRELGVAR